MKSARIFAILLLIGGMSFAFGGLGFGISLAIIAVLIMLGY